MHHKIRWKRQRPTCHVLSILLLTLALAAIVVVNQLLTLLTSSLDAEPSYICLPWAEQVAKEHGASKPGYKTEKSLKLHLRNLHDNEE